ncbi:Phosphatidylinositol 3- and 4-kinase family protein [Histomonas meleagridis]|uniref:Phosphatidylinositol 3- and 4-kinase family protein n=1 Tax=Histomonas meleagridis TaxID=135588 RepID=UPI00355A9C23|nr:Phosphatidylinositol 3- and 4-kinase family protein [Histomonas meleagridis]KAH0799022.1 Phosphatidylinositol 3- and 4-kinase family protein [Histomonas meleagridis]
MTEEQREHYEHEMGMIETFDKISQQLLPITPEHRKEELIKRLNTIEIPNDLYIPTNPEYKIISIISSESIPLKSHAKVPMLIKFQVIKDDNNNNNNSTNINISRYRPLQSFGCIFKIQDDVRMDSMIIQFIDKFLRIFKEAGIKCYMKPYKVIATGNERGVIECITNAKSRHEIGKEFPKKLLSYYVYKYGQIGTSEFNKAQQNFILSMAPYSLLCYIFQIKDRHNANIMIDDDGHILHIDFGFIFDITPAGGIEKAHFKLTNEMVELMGGSTTAPEFKQFKQLYTQCFIAIRSRFDEIEAIAKLMVNAGFPCFTQNSFVNLRKRLFLELRGADLLNAIGTTIKESLESKTTWIYDFFQMTTNGTYY